MAGSGQTGSGFFFFFPAVLPRRLATVALSGWRAAAFVCLLLATSARVFAQDPIVPAAVTAAGEEDPASMARFRLGPVRFTPALVVTNLGLNSNVFNEVDNPRSDTTAAIGPAVTFWIKVGRSRLSGKAAGQYLYFDKYVNQRSWGTTNDARWDVPLGHVTPFVIGSYGSTRQQQGYEIDIYARQRTHTVGLGTDLQLGGKTKVTLGATRTAVLFGDNELFLGVGLASVLNRKTETEQLQVRYKLTPLTTFVVSGLGVQDRFDLDPVRNANSIKVLPGFEFKPFALISGTVAVGYRWFHALDATMPDDQGLVASVDAKYKVGSTQLNAKVSRDLTYSFEPDQPYYTLTDLTLSITQRITSAWDVVARGGSQTLSYSRFASALTPGGRVDRGHQYGGGVGYRMGRTFRLGFDTIYYSRRSAANAGRDYEGLRSGVSISYGTQP